MRKGIWKKLTAAAMMGTIAGSLMLSGCGANDNASTSARRRKRLTQSRKSQAPQREFPRKQVIGLL